MKRKDLMVIVGIQVLSTVLVLSFLYWGVMKELKNISAAKSSSSSDTAALNALSARLGQVQVDLNMIKSKLGAGVPNQNR